ncbi:TPA: class I SAM-dependent RNA methyltransferase [Candidatus Saccharibacteria bacterium]|nr:MAG: putative RNA methyltransferase [Candidatus Saccharibacteria bacterium GW2011_GWC2_44_17]HBH77347.1 class I SAM-dependent RNA methyltransferase [Candidatus Saccharibacteria bacterium]
MTKKQLPIVEVKLDKIVGGGQTLGALDYGKKLFAWGGLPGETVNVQVTKKKSNFLEGVVTEVITPSEQRVEPRDEDSYLSTSPWQIMTFDAEQHYKSALIEEAFELHDIVLPQPIGIYSDNREFEYRNKIEYSFWWDKEVGQLDLAFFRRGTHGKIPVDKTSLAHPAINTAAHAIRDTLRNRETQAFNLKTVIVRCDQQGNVAAQLYVKDEMFDAFTEQELKDFQIAGFELIFSNPKSPASVITKRLQAWGETTLTDSILDVPFTYAVEGFFQINIPVYEKALLDMKEWVDSNKPTVDLYSGVGSIGLTIGGDNVTMVEINEHAVREMERNITAMDRAKTAKAILAPSETALEHITSDSTIILDPPRAGLHEDVVTKLLEAAPERIIYLSCNPVTQARDVARLAEKYGIRHHQGYNFFPRTPHIEHLIVLDKKA